VYGLQSTIAIQHLECAKRFRSSNF